MKLSDIENRNEVEKKASELAVFFTTTLQNYLSNGEENDIKQCPVCSSDFDPIEVGIEAKTLEGFEQNLFNKLNAMTAREDRRLAEYLMTEIMNTVIEAQIKRPGTELNKKLQELEPAIRSLRKIAKVMSEFKQQFQHATEKDLASTMMFNTLTEIDKVLATTYPE